MKEICLIDLPIELIVQDLALSRHLVRVKGFTKSIARIIDYEALDTRERRIVDEGDLLPTWASWWLGIVSEICYGNLCSNNSVIIIPGENNYVRNIFAPLQIKKSSTYRIHSLMIEEMCNAFTFRASSSGYAIAWGVENLDLNKSDFPLVCQGAIFPIVDGMGALFIGTDNDLQAFSWWHRLN